MTTMEGRGFYYPMDSTIARDGRIYVINRSVGTAAQARPTTVRVTVLNIDGEYFGTFGSFGSGDGFGEPGTGDGALDMPWGLTTDGYGDVLVADWGNDRVQRFSADGRFTATYGESGRGDGQFVKPSSVAVDSDGYMYVADWGNERLQVLTPEGAFAQALKGEATLSEWAHDFLRTNAEEAEARARADLEPEIEFFNDDPHEESSKLFWSPVSVVLDDAGRVYVTEGNRHRIQVFERANQPRG